MSELPARIEAEIAALADGSLAPERRAHVLARVQASPELMAELEAQRRALGVIQTAAVQAPDSLHARIEALLGPGAHSATGFGQAEPGRRLRRRARAHEWPLFAGALTLAGAAAAALALLLGSGPGSPSLSQAFALTLRPATRPAPQESADRSHLRVAVEGVSFPYLEERFGWRATGTRVDRLGDRRAVTVFYSDSRGRRVGYAILSGPAPPPKGGTVVWQEGVSYRMFDYGGVPVVTWTRGGHACVVSGRGLSAAMLVRLASWSEPGASKRVSS